MKARSAALIQWVIEWIWILFTAVFSYAVLFPIEYYISYSHTFINWLIVFAALTCLRFVLLFRRVPWFKPRFVRWIVLPISIWIFIVALNRLEYFLQLIDHFLIIGFADKDPDLLWSQQILVMNYIRIEILFFSLLLMISIFVLDIKIISSFWKKNKVRQDTTIYHYSATSPIDKKV